MMLAQYSLVILLIAVYGALNASALRFDLNPVTVDTQVLIVGRPARLKCNFVKYRTEAVREIKWFAGYTGFTSKIFEYSVTTGKKEATPLSFIRIDAASATEDELTITLTEFRDPTFTIGCEVEVVRDNGYGKLRHSKKLGESPINAVNNLSHQLLVKPDMDIGRYATPGETLSFTCISRGAEPAPKLSFIIEGKNVSSQIDGANVRLVDVSTVDGSSSPQQAYGSSQDSNGRNGDIAIIATILEVPEELFRGNYLTVECLAHYDDFLFAKKEMALEKKDSTTSNQNSGRPGGSYGGRQSDGYDSSRDSSKVDRYGYEANRRQQTTTDDYEGEQRRSSHSDRQGKDYGRADSDFEQRLMAMVDPARHVHPGIPYDFFSGYLVMVADNISPTTGNTAYVTLLGELPRDVEAELQRDNYGRVNQISEDQVRVKMGPVKVLNLLGQSGYRVVGASQSGKDGYVWTLEKKQFDVGTDTSTRPNAGGPSGYDGYNSRGREF